jgi:hypothetical protein
MPVLEQPAICAGLEPPPNSEGNHERLEHGKLELHSPSRKRFSIMLESKSLSDSSHGLWDVQPPPHVVEMHSLDIGQVVTFFEEKGYGFMDTADGRLFFHASGFRVPRMVPSREGGLPCQELQLAQVRPREKPTGNQPAESNGSANGNAATVSTEGRRKATHIPLPIITPQMGVMFHAGERNGRRQALTWCLQDMYEALKAELTSRYTEELRSWKQLGRYKLEFCELRQTGNSRANNGLKAFVPETKVVRTELFQGSNVDYLKDWFKGCRDSYRLSSGNVENPERWIELFFQVFDDTKQDYSPWERCDSGTMHDFLGT